MAGGNFEASLILLDDLWDGAFQQFVDGPRAVAIPARDILVFADARRADACGELRDVIARVWPGGDHLLSDKLFTRTAGAWTPAPSRRRPRQPVGRRRRHIVCEQGGYLYRFDTGSGALGPIVGKRTWGGLVGILGYPDLMDGGQVTAPDFASGTPTRAGRWRTRA